MITRTVSGGASCFFGSRYGQDQSLDYGLFFLTNGESTMLRSLLLKRILVVFVSMSFFTTYSLPAYAGIVTTEQMIQQQLEPLSRASLITMLDREDVRQQLIDRGVDPAYAKMRIAALSDQQVSEIMANIDDLPAGAGVLGILIVVLLVLIILDIIGVTNIFSFIHSPNK